MSLVRLATYKILRLCVSNANAISSSLFALFPSAIPLLKPATYSLADLPAFFSSLVAACGPFVLFALLFFFLKLLSKLFSSFSSFSSS